MARIPASQHLSDPDLTAASTTRIGTPRTAAAEFGAVHAFAGREDRGRCHPSIWWSSR
jgi:hypothetical protein